MENFDRYFLHDRRVFLDNISYETLKFDGKNREMKLNCKDTIVAQLMPQGVKICFNRALNFDPEGLYSLSVTFAVMLMFDPTTKDEVEWSKTDVAGEFKKSCPQLVSVLMSRASLLVAQITASSGQPPLITPAAPNMTKA